MNQEPKSKESFQNLLGELKKDYLRSLPQRMDKIRTHLDSMDWTALEEEFHKLKGSGKTYGCPWISETFSYLEVLASHQVSSSLDLYKNSLPWLEELKNYYENSEATSWDSQKYQNYIEDLKSELIKNELNLPKKV
jgi:HPt (histidine-containing phosphotransfer) domain-containing protein